MKTNLWQKLLLIALFVIFGIFGVALVITTSTIPISIFDAGLSWFVGALCGIGIVTVWREL